MRMEYNSRRTKILIFGLLVVSYLATEALTFASELPSDYVRIIVAPLAILYYLTLIPFDAIDNRWLDLGPITYNLLLIVYYYAIAYVSSRLIGGFISGVPTQVETSE